MPVESELALAPHGRFSQTENYTIPAYYLRSLGVREVPQISQYLINVLRLPDLNTKSGLKKMYNNFDNFSRRLDGTAEKYPEYPKVLAGILGIYGQLAEDTVLSRIVKDIDHLLTFEPTKCFAVHIFSRFAPTPGFREDIASRLPMFARLAAEHPNNRELCESIILVLLRSFAFPFHNNLDLWRPHIHMLNLLLANHLQKKWPSAKSIHRTYTVLVRLNQGFFDLADKTIALEEALVAGLTSPNWVVRAASASSLSDVSRVDSPSREDEALDLTAIRIFYERIKQSSADKTPASLPMHTYGLENCYTSRIISVVDELRKAVEEHHEDHDKLKLAQKLAVLLPDIVIEEGLFSAELSEIWGRLTGVEEQRPASPNHEPGAGEYMSQGQLSGAVLDNTLQPCATRNSVLLECAKVLRSEGQPEDLEAADILEVVSLHYSREELERAASLAKRAIARRTNLAHPYFYFILYFVGTTPDPEALESLLIGLRCTRISPQLQRRMLREAAGRCYFTGVRSLVRFVGNHWQSESGRQFIAPSATHIKTAVKFVKLGLDTMPPDDPYLGDMIALHVMLMFVIEGHTLRSSMDDLKWTKDLLMQSDEIQKEIRGQSGSFPHGMIRNTHDVATKLYHDAIAKYGVSVAKMNAIEETDVSLDSLGELSAPTIKAPWAPRVRQTSAAHQLIYYTCSNCQKPSAIFKKCARCLKARYCGPECQKKHWKIHKTECHAPRNDS